MSSPVALRAKMSGLYQSAPTYIRFGRWAAAAMAAWLVIGCSGKTAVYETREAPTGIEGSDAISVVLKSRSTPDGTASATEGLVAACVERGMREANPRLKFTRDAGAPSVRYIVTVEAHTTNSKAELDGGEGAIGIVWIEMSQYSAEVFDVKNDRVAGSVVSSAWGEEGAGVVLVIPIAFWSRSDNTACRALGKGVARLVAG